MKKSTILILVIYPLLFSCIDDEENINAIITGSIVDYYTSEKLPGATILLKDYIEIDPSNPAIRMLDDYDDTSQYIGRFFSDNDGNFNETFLLNKKKYYYLLVHDKNFISYTEGISGYHPNKMENFNVRVKRFKSIKLILKNDKHEIDSIYLSISALSNIEKEYKIRAVDTILYFDYGIPDLYCQINYNLFISNSSVKELKEIFKVSRFENDSIAINY